MALPQASLGSMPSISLGGYIPAARNDPSVLEQAIAAFLGGAAGTAGNRLVDKALPDPQRVAADKLARDRMAAEQVNNTAQIDVAKDRNAIAREDMQLSAAGRTADQVATDARSKADRDAAEVADHRRTMMALQARMGDNALQQTQYQTDAAQREEAMRLRAADETRAATERTATRQERAPFTAAQTRLLNAQASGLEDDQQRMSPQGRAAAAGQVLGMESQGATSEGTPLPKSDEVSAMDLAVKHGIGPVIGATVKPATDEIAKQAAIANLLMRYMMANGTQPTP